MSVTKIIKFYQFQPQPSMLNNGLTPMSTADILKKVFPKCGCYYILYSKEEYIIDILEIGNDFFFGKCAKKNDLPLTSFYQTRDKHTLEVVPYTSITADTQLEVYTFFYICCTRQRMAAIQHKNITQIHQILSEGIWDLSHNLIKVFVAPEKIKNVKQTARKIKSGKKLSISFAPNAVSKYNIDSLAQSLGDIKYDSFSVQIKLSPSNSDSIIDNVYDRFQRNKDCFSKMSLSGKNELGIDETIDFIETIFTHSDTFDITEDIVNNLEIIKNKLSESLNLPS